MKKNLLESAFKPADEESGDGRYPSQTLKKRSLSPTNARESSAGCGASLITAQQSSGLSFRGAAASAIVGSVFFVCLLYKLFETFSDDRDTSYSDADKLDSCSLALFSTCCTLIPFALIPNVRFNGENLNFVEYSGCENERESQELALKAQQQYQQGNCEVAIQQYGEALKKNPKDAVALNNRGLIFLHLKQVNKALRDFTDAIDIEPHHHSAHYNRALANYEQGNIVNAMQDFFNALSLSRDSKQRNHYNMSLFEGHQNELEALLLSGHYSEEDIDFIAATLGLQGLGTVITDDGINQAKALELIKGKADTVQAGISAELLEKFFDALNKADLESIAACLTEDPQLVFTSYSFADLTGRAFDGITALQYAYIAGDDGALGKILEYFPENQNFWAKYQLQHNVIEHHGGTFKLDNIIAACEKLIEDWDQIPASRQALRALRAARWREDIGELERQFPRHLQIRMKSSGFWCSESSDSQSPRETATQWLETIYVVKDKLLLLGKNGFAWSRPRNHKGLLEEKGSITAAIDCFSSITCGEREELADDRECFKKEDSRMTKLRDEVSDELIKSITKLMLWSSKTVDRPQSKEASDKDSSWSEESGTAATL